MNAKTTKDNGGKLFSGEILSDEERVLIEEFRKKKGEWKTKKDFISAMELLIYSNLDDVDVNEAKKYITGILGDNILDSKELIINEKISKDLDNIYGKESREKLEKKKEEFEWQSF